MLEEEAWLTEDLRFVSGYNKKSGGREALRSGKRR
jgi:hypothetical protein